MRETDAILGPVRGDPDSALAFLDRPDATDVAFVRAVWRWAVVAGVDPAIVFAWFLVETADATSIRWLRDHNPGGIAIPADSTVQPFLIPDGDAAARLFIQCLFAAVTSALHPDVPLWPEAMPWMDRVWLPKVNDPRFPGVRTITDLDRRYEGSDGEQHATWAWGHELGQPARLCVAKGKRVWPTLPDQGGTPVAEQIVFGRVPRPGNIVDDFVAKPHGRGWWDYGERTQLLALVLHAVKGYASGTGNYFRTFDARFADGGHGYNALTDWGICGAIDANVRGAIWDGRIMDWNDPDGRGLRRTPFASGGDGSKGITGDAVAFVDRYGSTAINKSTEAIELSLLNNTDPVSAKMMASLIALGAWRVDKKARVAWNVWPKNNDGLHMTLSHYELGKTACHIPDNVFEAFIEGVGATLKRYQLVAGTPDPAPPKPDSIYPPGMSPELAAALWDGPDGPLKLSWASRPFTFDPDRAECRFWLAQGKAQLKPGERWDKAIWPCLVNVVRRYKDRSVHAYHFSNGLPFEKKIK